MPQGYTIERAKIMQPLYTTKARAVGGRAGRVETIDGLLKVDLAYPKELGGNGGATNPEQLFAAGYAACFENAMRRIAREEKISIKGAAVTATVQLFPKPDKTYQLGVALEAEVEGVDQKTAELITEGAHRICPYSNATRGNIEVGITVHAK
jgi:lipoyl-dependent peroxiredoxin